MKHVGLLGSILSGIRAPGANTTPDNGADGTIFLFEGSVPANLASVPFFTAGQSLGETGTRTKSILDNCVGVIPYNSAIASNVKPNDTLNINKITGNDARIINMMMYPEYFDTLTTLNGNMGATPVSGPVDTDICIHKPHAIAGASGASLIDLTNVNPQAGSIQNVGRYSPYPWLADSAEHALYAGEKTYVNAATGYTYSFRFRQNITFDHFIVRLATLTAYRNAYAGNPINLAFEVYWHNGTSWVLADGKTNYLNGGSSNIYALYKVPTPITTNAIAVRGYPNTGITAGNQITCYTSEYGFGLKTAGRIEVTYTPTWALVCPNVSGFQNMVSDKGNKRYSETNELPMILVEVGTAPNQLNLNKTTFSNLLHDRPALNAPLAISIA